MVRDLALSCPRAAPGQGVTYDTRQIRPPPSSETGTDPSGICNRPTNILYINLVKCLLAKILDERNTRKGKPYSFQVLHKSGKEESAANTFDRVNGLYKTAYTRYIDPSASAPDEINPKEFPADRVKTVVKTMQGMSITRGAALHADVIGAFFEEILRVGFKQDKGMYFTHANLVHFMLEAVDVTGLTVATWKHRRS